MQQIHEEETATESFFDGSSQEDFDGFGCYHRSNGTGQGSDNGWGHFLGSCSAGGKKIRITHRTAITEDSELPAPSGNTAIYPRNSESKRSTIYQIARLSIVRSIDNKVALAGQHLGIQLRKSFGESFRTAIAIHRLQTSYCRNGFGLSQIGFGKEHLTLEIADADAIIIDNADMPHACSTEILQDRATKASGSYDKDMRTI